MATQRSSSRDFAVYARHCVGARRLLCRRRVLELEIFLSPAYHFLASDYSLLDCGSMAVCEAKLTAVASLSKAARSSTTITRICRSAHLRGSRRLRFEKSEQFAHADAGVEQPTQMTNREVRHWLARSFFKLTGECIPWSRPILDHFDPSSGVTATLLCPRGDNSFYR